jgi:antitoxin PrlF
MGMDATITAKGQMTVPKRLREGLGVPNGGKIRILQHSDGSVYILPVVSMKELTQSLPPAPKRNPVSIEEMDEGVAQAVAERDRRSKRS